MDVATLGEATRQARSAASSRDRLQLYRAASLLKGYSIVADLNRPFLASVTDSGNKGISQMCKKRHIAVADATDLVVMYANWKGASDTANGPGNTPIYVRCGIGNTQDGDVFPATFGGGLLSEGTVQPGRVIATDPIAGSRIFAGQPFFVGTFVRVDQVLGSVTTTSGSNSLTAVAITSGGPFYVGQYIYGTGIPAGVTITAIGAGTLTISASANASAAGVAVNAYGNWGVHSVGYNGDADRMNSAGSGAVQTSEVDRTADTTLLTWGSASEHFGYGAALILGRTAVSRPVRVMAARVDSIGTGAGDNTPTANTSSGSAQYLGWVERTWGADGIMLLGHGGIRKAVMTTPPATAAAGYRQAHAQRLLAGATGVIFQDGTNDIANFNATTNTVAMLQATFIKDWRKAAGDRGNVGWQATILPRVASSSDFYLSTAGQVATTYEAAQLAINAWLRDGAPINADYSPAAVGATDAGVSRCGYLGWDGTRWVKTSGSTTDTIKHPLALGGVFEVADAVETARDSRRWARAWEATGTLTSGSPTITGVTTTAGTFNTGPRATIVSGVGVPLATSGTLSSGTLTLSANATASGTGVLIGQPYTDDGTHPTGAGHSRIVDWITQVGTDGLSARTIIRDSCNVT